MKIRDLHNEAMDLAQKAIVARFYRKGSVDRLFRRAFEKERRAALQAVAQDAPEPTRSILLRSAAALAMECEEPRQAERLIGQALAGDPPDEIAEELRDMFRKVGLAAANGHAKPRRRRAVPTHSNTRPLAKGRKR